MSVAMMPSIAQSVEKTEFRNAMAHLAAAVNIITTDGPGGLAGFTASAVCSVSDSPPTLLICLNRAASVWPAFQQNRALCVNTLAAGQEALSNLFGGKTAMSERFAAAEWSTLATGAPLLSQALIAFDCLITQVSSIATHDVLFCEVQAITLNTEADGLIWFDRNYHALMRQEAR